MKQQVFDYQAHTSTQGAMFLGPTNKNKHINPAINLIFIKTRMKIRYRSTNYSLHDEPKVEPSRLTSSWRSGFYQARDCIRFICERKNLYSLKAALCLPLLCQHTCSACDKRPSRLLSQRFRVHPISSFQLRQALCWWSTARNKLDAWVDAILDV